MEILKRMLILLFLPVILSGMNIGDANPADSLKNKNNTDLSGFEIEPMGLSAGEEKEESRFVVAVDMPIPVGGLPAIHEKIYFTNVAAKHKIHGRMTVKAYVNKNGDVEKTEIIKGLGYGLDEVAMEAVKNSKFKPGYNIKREAVDVQVAVPILFYRKGWRTPEKEVCPKSDYDNHPDEQARPEKGFMDIQSKVYYPRLAKQDGIKGKVIVQAYINDDGDVECTEVLQGLGYGLDEIAADAVKESDFIPGKMKGEEVKSKIVIPVIFQ